MSATKRATRPTIAHCAREHQVEEEAEEEVEAEDASAIAEDAAEEDTAETVVPSMMTATIVVTLDIKPLPAGTKMRMLICARRLMLQVARQVTQTSMDGEVTLSSC